MKTHPSRSQNGFTLVELLVVIAIIAVLAAASFAGVNMAMQKAKKTTAQATCVAIEQAVNTFCSEYGGMPIDPVPTTPVDTSQTGPGVDLLVVLTGKEPSTGAVLNTRGVNFLSIREGKSNRNGMMFNATGVPTGLFDPWGGGYQILLDHDFDDIVEPQPTGTTATTKLNNRKVAIWSEGADYQGAKKPADDVRTW